MTLLFIFLQHFQESTAIIQVKLLQWNHANLPCHADLPTRRNYDAREKAKTPREMIVLLKCVYNMFSHSILMVVITYYD